MKRVFLTLIVLGLATPVAAQETDTEPYFEGLNEFADGMRKLLEGFAEDLEPMMDTLAKRLEGLQGYHAPEVLPNGDIIIRKKTPQEKRDDDEQDAAPTPEGDAIEL